MLKVNQAISNALGVIGEQGEDTQVSAKQVLSPLDLDSSTGEFIDASGLLFEPELRLYPSASQGSELGFERVGCAGSLAQHRRPNSDAPLVRSAKGISACCRRIGP
jgi:hypothetical protein